MKFSCTNTKFRTKKEATEEDNKTEYLDYILSVKIVENLQQAVNVFFQDIYSKPFPYKNYTTRDKKIQVTYSIIKKYLLSSLPLLSPSLGRWFKSGWP